MTEILLKPIDWDYLIDKIIDEECLLVLGSEAYSNENGITCHDRLLENLDIKNNKNIKKFYPEEGFFLFDHPSSRTKLCHQIKKFYNNENQLTTLERLSDIPFHIYMTVTPDKLLLKHFEKNAYKYQFGYYKKNTEPQPIKSLSKNFPLIYNIFGCIENEESLVLSHDDLYDYFKSIFARKSMPKELKDDLKNIRNVILLGIPFSKWYLQLILRELEIHNNQYAFTRYAANQSLSDELSTFCADQFSIQFIDKNIVEFIEDLHEKCSKRGLLRTKKEPEVDIKSVIKKFIANGEIEKSIEALEIAFQESQYQDDIDKLSGRYNRLKKRVMAGILSFEERTLEENQISDSLLNLVNQI